MVLPSRLDGGWLAKGLRPIGVHRSLEVAVNHGRSGVLLAIHDGVLLDREAGVQGNHVGIPDLSPHHPERVEVGFVDSQLLESDGPALEVVADLEDHRVQVHHAQPLQVEEEGFPGPRVDVDDAAEDAARLLHEGDLPVGRPTHDEEAGCYIVRVIQMEFIHQPVGQPEPMRTPPGGPVVHVLVRNDHLEPGGNGRIAHVMDGEIT